MNENKQSENIEPRMVENKKSNQRNEFQKKNENFIRNKKTILSVRPKQKNGLNKSHPKKESFVEFNDINYDRIDNFNSDTFSIKSSDV